MEIARSRLGLWDTPWVVAMDGEDQEEEAAADVVVGLGPGKRERTHRHGE